LRLSAYAVGSIANRRDFSKEISEIALTIHRSLARSALLNEHWRAGVVAVRGRSRMFAPDFCTS
jgi:hypothetical protein